MIFYKTIIFHLVIKELFEIKILFKNSIRSTKVLNFIKVLISEPQSV